MRASERELLKYALTSYSEWEDKKMSDYSLIKILFGVIKQLLNTGDDL